MSINTNSHPGVAQADAALFPATGEILMADGGLETTLVFHQDIDLPDFAAFPLLRSEPGREALRAYYRPYLESAARHGVGMVLDTPTWRANLDWGIRQGFASDDLAAVNREAVAFARSLAVVVDRNPVRLVNGVIGPRGDGYAIGQTMNPVEAAHYHALQARAFAQAGADLVTAVTMTYVDEAIGIVRAAAAVGLPVIVSFTVETDGRLPSGQTLAEAVTAVDDHADSIGASRPQFYMINCAHPSHFVGELADDTVDHRAPWIDRIGAIRANASRLSHEELDNATELDRGDIAELADDYRALHSLLPGLKLVGGCCGTDHEHVEAVVSRLSVS